MQHRIKVSFHFAGFIALLLALSLCCFSPAVPVYALPEQATGWVEVQCNPIPEDFSDTATVVFSNTETGEYYTVTCHKINDYVGRLKVPTGKYQVEQASTADNFTYEASTETSLFEITTDMPAAQLITLSVIKHDASYELPPAESESVSDLSSDTSTTDREQDESEGSDDPIASDTKEDSNSVLDWILQESSADDTESAEDNDTVQTEEDAEPISFDRVVLVILGTVLFIIIIMIIAFFARQYFIQD